MAVEFAVASVSLGIIGHPVMALLADVARVLAALHCGRQHAPTTTGDSSVTPSKTPLVAASAPRRPAP